MQIIAIVCQKGGVGKSTIALNLGAGLFYRGKKILFIDLDPQGNMTETLLVRDGLEDILVGSMKVLKKEIPINEALCKSTLGDVLSSELDLYGADLVLSVEGKEYLLKEAIDQLNNNYDYVIIDTPPTLGNLTINALTACNKIIITSQPDLYSLKSIGQLSLTINAVKEFSNHKLSIEGILLTRYSKRSVLNKHMLNMLEETAEGLGTKVFSSKIREAVAIRESQAEYQDIFTYAPKSGVANDIELFIDEFLEG